MSVWIAIVAALVLGGKIYNVCRHYDMRLPTVPELRAEYTYSLSTDTLATPHSGQFASPLTDGLHRDTTPPELEQYISAQITPDNPDLMHVRVDAIDYHHSDGTIWRTTRVMHGRTYESHQLTS